VVVVVEGGVGPVEQEVPVLLWDTEERGDCLQWQLGGDLHQEVARIMIERFVEQRCAPGGELGLHLAKSPRTHRRCDQPTYALVSGVVLHVEQHAGGKVRRQILDEGAATATGAPADRGEQERLSGRPCHIVMTGEAPESLAIGCVRRGVVPEHWRLVTQVPVDVMGWSVGEEIRVGQVDAQVVRHATLPPPAPGRRRSFNHDDCDVRSAGTGGTDPTRRALSG
jgi:hypothetical protein